MSAQALVQASELPPCSVEDQKAVEGIVSVLLQSKEVQVPVGHFIHAGCYARTCLVQKGSAIVGALITIPTVVIVSGRCEVTAGPAVRLVDGFAVLKAAAGRRQAFFAHEDTFITMVFATQAKTVAEAEKEFTDEWELLTTNCEGGLRGKV